MIIETGEVTAKNLQTYRAGGPCNGYRCPTKSKPLPGSTTHSLAPGYSLDLTHRPTSLPPFPSGNEVSQDGLLLHGPFARKPKRIRTAFSPSQLLRLERAFEKNHYVVGAERKQLAHGLSLSETQVSENQLWWYFGVLCFCF